MLISSRKEAADALGVTDRTLGSWKLESTFPDCSKGHDIASIKKWRAANVGKKHERKSIDFAEIRRLQKAITELTTTIENHFSRKS